MIADRDSDVSGVGSDLLPFACNRNYVIVKGSNIPVYFFLRKTGMKMKKKRSNLMNRTWT